MACSLKAAQDILFSGEAYRIFVCSARSVATKNFLYKGSSAIHEIQRPN